VKSGRTEIQKGTNKRKIESKNIYNSQNKIPSAYMTSLRPSMKNYVAKSQ